ncbi:serine/threonine-protein kinase [Amycolatopsis vastitatis]|uniref:non-specific serine/threonine protein kinase n=1 Tax=Amycolatopsis vastitatis TaxID=1905142 RepID=A0A229SPX4_9PSEU|nr:serine/threonine-protein kinase [Amycolatopsis vastitatis]OXM60830.1 serine/threonine protein kinase [Amycolatopsis vastitatis]
MGRVVAGRYRLEEELGRGGMGVVWRAVDLELGRQVTLKRALGEDAGQIRREARIGAGLLHSNVVTVFDTVVDGDAQWLVTEYLAARSLEELVDDEGPLPEDRVRRIGAQLASALADMHSRGIIHRDVKPGNVLVTADDVAKLTDLGIARWTEVTRTGGAQLTGTLGYVAPEVADGAEAGAASDVFSLGATLYAAIEGRSPWGSGEDGPFAQMRRAAAGRPAPAERAGPFAPVLAALMARHPADRPGAAEVVTLLTADAPAPLRRPGRRLRRRLLAGAAVLAVAALVAGFVVGRPLWATTTGAPAGANTLGPDPAGTDPCAAISLNSLTSFGEPFVDPEVLNFGTCVVTTTLADGTGQVQTRLDLTGPLRYPPRPPVPGKMGEIEYPEAHDGSCERAISLADANRIVVTSHPVTRAQNAPLCTFSEAVLSGVLATLANGPLPRRAQPLPDWSLAHVDACGLLDDATTSGVLGQAKEPDRGFGRWNCTWEHDPRTITVEFSREWPIEADEDVPGDRIRVGTRTAVIAPVPGGHPECAVKVVHRSYTPVLPVLRGTPSHREEIAVVSVEDTAAAGGDALCATARSLAEVLVRRLP